VPAHFVYHTRPPVHEATRAVVLLCDRGRCSLARGRQRLSAFFSIFPRGGMLSVHRVLRSPTGIMASSLDAKLAVFLHMRGKP